VNVALTNAMGFAGSNTVVIIGKFNKLY